MNLFQSISIGVNNGTLCAFLSKFIIYDVQKAKGCLWLYVSCCLWNTCHKGYLHVLQIHKGQMIF